MARQLIAISDAGSLVCFAVYPVSAAKAVKELFKQYDQAFAAALNLPLYPPVEEDTGYKIASILSVSWWDDGSWDYAPKRPKSTKLHL